MLPTVTSKGQTTLPGKIRSALRTKPGDRLEYVVQSDGATIRVHPGARSREGTAGTSGEQADVWKTPT